MKKPEKIEDRNIVCCDSAFTQGWNQSYDSWEDFLPDFTELKILILRFIAGKDCPYTHFKSRIVSAEELTDLARVIAKRIGKNERTLNNI